MKDARAVYTPGISERASGTSKFYHTDALGSTRGITNGSQTVTDAVLYDGFGMTVSRTGSTPTPFGFVGAAQYQSDADSGLQLLGHRMYDPSVGRFISQDPIRDGDNWYAYCDNDPLSLADPSGLKPPNKKGDPYKPITDVVIGIGDSLRNEINRPDQREWIGVIIQTPDGRLRSSKPDLQFPGAGGGFDDNGLPPKYKIVGYWHTHPIQNEAAGLASDRDHETAGDAEHKKLPIYIIVGDGDVLIHRPGARDKLDDSFPDSGENHRWRWPRAGRLRHTPKL